MLHSLPEPRPLAKVDPHAADTCSRIFSSCARDAQARTTDLFSMHFAC
ncbi:MAG: hypothetical protein WBA47_07100 [Rhodanobacter sp.]|jgi:hypothetical protein